MNPDDDRFLKLTPDVLERIMKKEKLLVDTIVLRSKEDFLSDLLAKDIDFVITLSQQEALSSVKEILAALDNGRAPICLLAFRFAASSE